MKTWLVVGSLAAAGCAAAPGEVKIRPIADPGAKLRTGDDRLGVARGQLVLGNVGLALEGFRRAAREQPDSAEAFAGMAACYDAMARYDLAQVNYEAALALAPRDPALLTALAVSLQRQGKGQAAAAVREEVAQLNAAALVLEQAQAELETTPRTVEAAPVVTVALPAPQVGATVAVTLPRAHPLGTLPARPLAASNVAVTMPVDVPVLRMPTPQSAQQITVALSSVLLPLMQRMSLCEVALLTGSGPIWRPQVVASTPQKLTVRWVSLTTASARPNIRLLNAARRQGLAARNRDYLLGRGWRKIEIGDASELRELSLVLYPAARPTLGRRLAAQFGFRSRAVDKGETFVVLLGRDAATARRAQVRG
jgi:tetratricopeptide (TPR) repeat protein